MNDAIWLPRVGVTNLQARRVHTAVNEYDENLLFAVHPETNQWCVFRKIPNDTATVDGFGTEVAGQRVIPILGFTDIPHPEDALKRIYSADAVRRGEEILDQMNRENEALKEPARKAAQDGAGILAEGMEWAFRERGYGDKLVLPVQTHMKNRMGGWA